MDPFFTTHEPNCSTHRPCRRCRAIDFLRTKLSADDYRAFVHIVADKTEETLYTVENPAPLNFVLRDHMKISVRIENALRFNDIHTFADLALLSRPQLLRIPNFGRKSWEELEAEALRFGYKLKFLDTD